MHKFSLLITGAALLLTGCATKKSAAWQAVRAVPHAAPREKSPAAAYANRLHVALRDAGIEHRVVTFTFRHGTRLLLRREGEETAVIYRDPATPRHPWWLMAERLSTPVWLPTEQSACRHEDGHHKDSQTKPQDIQSQLNFYVSRPVNIIKIEDFPASGTKQPSKKGAAAK